MKLSIKTVQIFLAIIVWVGVGLVFAKNILVNKLQVFEVGQSAGPKMYIEKMFPVVVKTTATYSNTIGGLILNIYQPEGDARIKRPALVAVHGGAFAYGSKDDHDMWGNYFAERGYVVFSINYRLTPENQGVLQAARMNKIMNRATGAGRAGSASGDGYEDIILPATADAMAAVRWIRANADKYGVDAEKIAMAGNSAGAIISLYATHFPADYKSINPSNGDQSEKIKAVVSLSGAISDQDLGKITTQTAPSIMFTGGNDTLVPTGNQIKTKDKLKSLGNRVDFYLKKSLGHPVWSIATPEVIAQFLYETVILEDSSVSNVLNTVDSGRFDGSAPIDQQYMATTVPKASIAPIATAKPKPRTGGAANWLRLINGE